MRSTLLTLSLACLIFATGNAIAQQAPREIEHGTYAVHLILHTIGTEE